MAGSRADRSDPETSQPWNLQYTTCCIQEPGVQHVVHGVQEPVTTDGVAPPLCQRWRHSTGLCQGQSTPSYCEPVHTCTPRGTHYTEHQVVRSRNTTWFTIGTPRGVLSLVTVGYTTGTPRGAYLAGAHHVFLIYATRGWCLCTLRYTTWCTHVPTAHHVVPLHYTTWCSSSIVIHHVVLLVVCTTLCTYGAVTSLVSRSLRRGYGPSRTIPTSYYFQSV